MFLRAFVGIIMIIAVIVGVLAVTLPRDQIVRLIMFRDFFDVSLPILAFGALVKYLAMCRSSNACCCNGKCSCSDCKTSCSPAK